ncbi:polyprotein, partial [Schistosoma japonicum]
YIVNTIIVISERSLTPDRNGTEVMRSNFYSKHDCSPTFYRFKDPRTVIRLTSLCENKESARFTLRVSGNPTATTAGLAGVSIALSSKVEKALLDWIPIDSRLYAVLLNGTVRTRKDRDTRRNLFVVSVYAPTDCSSNKVKDGFYRKLSDLLCKTERTDVVIVVGDFNAQ